MRRKPYWLKKACVRAIRAFRNRPASRQPGAPPFYTDEKRGGCTVGTAIHYLDDEGGRLRFLIEAQADCPHMRWWQKAPEMTAHFFVYKTENGRKKG